LDPAELINYPMLGLYFLCISLSFNRTNFVCILEDLSWV